MTRRRGSGTAPPGDAAARYGLELDLDSVPGLCEQHGLVFPTGGG